MLCANCKSELISEKEKSLSRLDVEYVERTVYKNVRIFGKEMQGGK